MHGLKWYTLFIVLVILGFANPSGARAEAQELTVSSHSELSLGADGTVIVRRIIILDVALTALLRGSSEATSQSMAGYFARSSHAFNGRCDAVGTYATLMFACGYEYRLQFSGELSHQTAMLPSDSMVAYLAPLTVNYPYALRVEEETIIQAPGMLLSLPAVERQQIGEGSEIDRVYHLDTADRVIARTSAFVAPGDGLQPQILISTPLAISFTTSYFPSTGNWILFLLTAASIWIYIGRMTPVHRVWPVRRTKLTAIRNTISGSILCILGLASILVGLAWIGTASQIELLGDLLGNLFVVLPRALLLDLLNAGPYITLALGLVISVVGIGILRWYDWARRGALVLALAVFASTTAISAFLLLLPEMFPGQGLVFLGLVELCLVPSMSLVLTLSTVEMRLRYCE
jgi:hypothetical protein